MARRDEVLVAAVAVLGDEGLYGLTHRKVDRAAGLPEGSTSNCFRSRASLLHGVVEHLVSTEQRVWASDGALAITGQSDVVAACAGFVRWALSDGRARSLAHVALLEAAITAPDVSAVLRDAREAIENDAAVVCERANLDGQATAILLDSVDAVVFRQLAIGADRFDPEPYFARLVEALATD